MWHPIAAIGAAVWWAGLSHFASLRSEDEAVQRTALAVFIIILIQLAHGVLNVALRAPIWMQLVHLAVADVLVVACAVFSSEILLRGLTRKAQHSGEATSLASNPQGVLPRHEA